MDNHVGERDYALLAQDKYTFSVLSRIIARSADVFSENTMSRKGQAHSGSVIESLSIP